MPDELVSPTERPARELVQFCLFNNERSDASQREFLLRRKAAAGDCDLPTELDSH